MNALIQLINTVSRYLREQDIPHAMVGGMAVAIWGRPRATEDVDLLVDLKESQLEPLQAYLAEHGVRMKVDKAKLALEGGTSFPMYDSWSVHWVDARPATRPVDHMTLQRATTVELSEERVPIATPEDVVLGKLLSPRAQDLLDARSIVLRKGDELDLEYLDARVHELKIEAQWDKVRPEIV